jgi:glycosyltransferase involved in cell wall biosynthesis
MVGPHPPAVGGVAENMRLLMESSLAKRFELIPFSTAKHRKHVFPNRPHWDSLPYLVWNKFRLMVALLRVRPHVVYVMATSDTGFVRDAVLMLTARVFGRRVLCHLHGRPRGRLFAADGGSWTWFSRWGMKWAQATIVLSPGLAAAFGRMFPGQPLVVVPNVVEVERFHPGGEGRTGALRILTVGRVSREKGTWDLLEVAKGLVDTSIPVQFRLCGMGETRAEEIAIRRRAEDLGLQANVEFLGVRQGPDLLAEYAQADVFFLPTHAEIFPTVILEALAAGLPIVTTNAGVIPEMFEQGVEGYQFQPGDIAGMTGALTRLAGDGELRASMSRSGRALAEARYGVERAAERVGACLAALAEGDAIPRDLLVNRKG